MYKNYSKIILEETAKALDSIDATQAKKLADALCSARKVFVIGVGRVLLMLQAFVKRLNHLGIEAYFVGEINEPAITGQDLLIVGSGSGETAIPVAIAKIASKFGPKIAYIGSNLNSAAAKAAEIIVRIPCRTKLALPDELQSRQPMSSLFEQSLLLFCDTAAMMIIEKKGIEDIHALWQKHANLE